MNLECIRCGQKQFSTQSIKNWICPNCEQELASEDAREWQIEAEIEKDLEGRHELKRNKGKV